MNTTCIFAVYSERCVEKIVKLLFREHFGHSGRVIPHLKACRMPNCSRTENRPPQSKSRQHGFQALLPHYPTPSRIIPASSITTAPMPAAVLKMPTATAARGRATNEPSPSAIAVKPIPAIARASTLDATNSNAATAMNCPPVQRPSFERRAPRPASTNVTRLAGLLSSDRTGGRFD